MPPPSGSANWQLRGSSIFTDIVIEFAPLNLRRSRRAACQPALLEDPMPRFCSSCGAVLPESAISCPACSGAVPVGGGVAAAPATMPAASGLADNLAGALAYLTFIPAILFLMTAPYNQNRFIRFHSFQSLAL